MTRDIPQLDVLQMVPDRFGRVQVWGVAQQLLQAQAPPSRVGQKQLDGLVSRGGQSIPNDQQLPPSWTSKWFRKRSTSGPLKARSCICTSNCPCAVIPLRTER